MVQQNLSLVEVSGCFVWNQDKFLMLKRTNEGSQANKWGLPAGKLENGESVLNCVIREVQEESGIIINPENVKFLGAWDWKFPNINLRFHTFSTFINSDFEKIEIKLNPEEHVDYVWLTPTECDKKEGLIHGMHDLLRLAGYIKN